LHRMFTDKVFKHKYTWCETLHKVTMPFKRDSLLFVDMYGYFFCILRSKIVDYVIYKYLAFVKLITAFI